MVATRRSAPRRPQSYDRALLTVAEMGRADRMTIDAGTPGERLMERAGEGVAAAICRRWAPRPVAVLCGPGNNGGDGFVVGRRLAGAGWDVRLGLLGRRASLRGDAALNAGRWTCPVVELADAVAAQRLIAGTGLIVDALFGAGLVRPLDGLARDTVEAMDRSGVPVVAVDVPSGVDGDTGLVRGAAPRATLTVTFFRPKPGHYLLPGRTLCGELEVVDIGISATVLETVGATIFLNDPSLWAERFPWPTIDTH
jgi:NAD(P)H-hydrate epimerase